MNDYLPTLEEPKNRDYYRKKEDPKDKKEKITQKRKEAFMSLKPQVAEALNQGKIGRNKPCPCGSGSKFKKCCLPKINILL
jgi:uncharacterized protein YecA (UPF0149 family)